MASVQVQPAPPRRSSKTRSKLGPILKKLAPSEKMSASPKGSERARVEDKGSIGKAGRTGNGNGNGNGGGNGESGRAGAAGSATGLQGDGRSKLVRDVKFALDARLSRGVSSAQTSGGSWTGRAPAAAGQEGSEFGHLQHRHSRSISGGSNSRLFVHPALQTPRTATPPPVSHTNSFASLKNSARDCSPTITEADDDENDQNDQNDQNDEYFFARNRPSYYRPTQSHLSSSSKPRLLIPHSPSNLGRPPFSSQRTASFPEAGASAPAVSIIVSSGRLTPVPTSRLAYGSLSLNTSHNDLGQTESPLSSSNTHSNKATSPSSTSAPLLSPLRNSLDMAGFPRLRSRSEMDGAERAESIRAARRKFEEKERAQELKHDRKMIRKRERRDTKEASRIEKEEASLPRNSFGYDGPSTTSRKSAQHSRHHGVAAAAASATASRAASYHRGWASTASSSGNDMSFSMPKSSTFAGTPTSLAHEYQYHSEKHAGPMHEGMFQDYEHQTAAANGPGNGNGVEDVDFQQARPKRGSKVKYKTNSYWHAFWLWLRTKILRLTGR